MKANELMPGDLVTFKDCQNDANPVVIKIWQINADGDAFVSIDGRDELEEISIDDEIVGIPLTPEILEKNGWKDISDNTLKGCETFRLHLEQRSFDYTLTLKMRPPYGISGRMNIEEWRVEVAAELGYKLALIHLGIGIKKRLWR